MVAVLDTGAQMTIVSKSFASRLGLTDEALHLDPPFRTKGAAGETLPSFLHRFTQLNIGPISISNPVLVVTDVQLTEGDIVLGMDFLATRRLWLSPTSFRLFFSDPKL